MFDWSGRAEARAVILDTEAHQGAQVEVLPAALSPEEADLAFTELRDSLDWRQREITLFGKRHRQPRLVAFYGEADAPYRYSGQTLTPLPWTPLLRHLRDTCESLTGARFNSVLCNLYRDGNDAMGWHADDEPELGEQPVIASLSVGQPRRFDLRHKHNGSTHQYVLPHGSLLIMAGNTQRDWKHQLPRSKKVTAPRINLTFRWISARIKRY